MVAKLLVAFLIAVWNVHCVISIQMDEVIALTRDHLGRKNPDELMYGFAPAWAAVLFGLAGAFLVVAILTGICSIAGCNNPVQPKATLIAKDDY